VLVGLKIQPADQTPPKQSDKYQCRIDTAIFPLIMGTWMPETCREEKYINILNRIVHGVGIIYEIIQGCTVNKIYNLDVDRFAGNTIFTK
jgi:hypothetical protein